MRFLGVGTGAVWLGLGLFAGLGLRAAEEAEMPGLRRGPVPSWVESLGWSKATKPPPPGTPGQVLLNDSQDRLTPEVSEYYFRTVTHLLNSEGVRQNAEQSVVYSPEYQEITWHALRITRGVQEIDLLPAVKFKQLQRELGLEAKVYDGQLTAVAVLEDIRVGDVLEVAYTRRDSNPLMRGHISGRHYLGAGYPIQKQSLIIRLAAAVEKPAWHIWIPPGTQGLPEALFRHARLKLALREEETGDERIYRWEADNLPALRFDAQISPQAAPYYPVLRCSSFRTWADVAAWATPLFESAGPLPEEMKEHTAGWRTRLPGPAERMRAAVDWVQGDVRYFAMAMGDHNIRPRPLREICASRFGDCKDKTVLLVALLRELGFAAWPALVNTYAHDLLLNGGADQYAFNHAIVVYENEGRLHWIDPTLKQPAGPLAKLAVPPYRAGLILRAGETALTELPADPLAEPDTLVRDSITVDPTTGEAQLRTEVTIRGLQADFYRQRMEATSPDETSKQWFNYIGRFYRRLREESAPEIEDDRASNEIRIRAGYRMPDYISSEGGRTSLGVHAYMLRALIDSPESRRRHWPYALPTGRRVMHEIEVTLPFEAPVEQRPQVISANGVSYRVAKSVVGGRFRSVHDLTVTGDYVAAADMDRFADAIEEILLDLSAAINRPVVTTKPVASP